MGEGEGQHGGDGSAAAQAHGAGAGQVEQDEEDGEGDAFLFGQERGGVEGYGEPAAVGKPGIERGDAERRGEQSSAGEDVIHGLGLDGMDGKDQGGDPGGTERQDAGERAMEQQDGGEVEQQVHHVVTHGVRAAERHVDAEGEVGQRADGFERGEPGVCKQRVVVKVKRASQRESKSEEGGGDEEDSVPQVLF